MSIVKRHLAEHEERLALIEEICIDKGALVLDTATARSLLFCRRRCLQKCLCNGVSGMGKGHDQGHGGTSI